MSKHEDFTVMKYESFANVKKYKKRQSELHKTIYCYKKQYIIGKSKYESKTRVD